MYVLHFPIPYVNGETHEINQRMVLLLGVGKMLREEKSKVNQIRKQLMDLFNGGNHEKKTEILGYVFFVIKVGDQKKVSLKSIICLIHIIK